MHENPPQQETKSGAGLRAQRSDEALIARYILELSGRHARIDAGRRAAGRRDSGLVDA